VNETTISRPDGDVSIVKIQIGENANTPMMVYDRKKNIEFLLHPGNSSAQGCQKIFQLIRTKGEAGGRKGYFNCQVYCYYYYYYLLLLVLSTTTTTIVYYYRCY
jgi:hypothetical protein